MNPIPVPKTSVVSNGSALPTAAPAPAPQVLKVNLHNIPLLSGLDSAMLAQLGKTMQFRSFRRGSHVLHKGSAGDHLVFLLTGRLQVVDVTEDGDQVGLSFVSPGDYLGELSIIDGLPRSASVVATKESLLAFLPRPHAARLIYSNALVAERVLKRLAAKVRSESTHRAILCIPSAFRRVFALLNQLAKEGPGGLVVIDGLPTQQEIAIMVNTSRETVSRAMHVLLQKGIVEKDMRRLIVRNPAALKDMALENVAPLDAEA